METKPTKQMPIHHKMDNGVIQTILVGRVTDEDLLLHYKLPIFENLPSPWHELVDGTQITDMAVSSKGQKRLAQYAAANVNRLRGGRVAMVASSDITYGMFRMWEIQREDLDYEVRVFREIEPAQEWIGQTKSKV